MSNTHIVKINMLLTEKYWNIDSETKTTQVHSIFDFPDPTAVQVEVISF